jgi:hypothetical protein
MKLGHVLALIGGLLVLIGSLALPWQSFELAEVMAEALMVRPTGLGILGLGAGITVLSALGLVLRKRKQIAMVSLFLAVSLFGWLVAAHVTRSSAFMLMPYEIVDMQIGYSLAVWGSFFSFFGALMVLASEPAMDPNANFLRVAMLWGDTCLEERVLQEPATVQIGEDLRNDFIIPAHQLPKKFPLFRSGRNDQYAIGLSTDLHGEVTINGTTQSIAEFVKGSTENVSGVNFVDVSPGDWGVVTVGELRFYFQFVQPDGSVGKKGFLWFDELVASAVAMSFLFQVGFLAMSVFLWQESAIRIVKQNQRKIPTADAIIIEPEEPEELEDGEEDDDTAKRAEGEEGKFGDPDEDPLKESKVPKNEGEMVDKIDPKKVGLNDLLSTNKLGGSAAIANIMQSADGFSNKIAVAMAGSGTEFVMGHGSGGLGFKGTGTGGGGDGGYGRIHGMGKIDTGGGLGVRAGLGKKKAKRVGKLKVGSGASTGFCKKSNLKSVVRRRAGAIRACYESRLQVSPKLSGKLTARWTVTANGSVSNVSAGGSMKDGKVKNCVLRVLRRMRFAKPEGGNVCIVQWPFVFNSGG